jgi:3-oxoacyl-[acyl-carrier-protein] synthase I
MRIAATGMVCAVGLNAAAACAAIRAGIANFNELPYCDNRGEPIIGAMIQSVDATARRGQRLLKMVTLAVEDCLGTTTLSTEKIPLLMALPESSRPGNSADFSTSILKHIQEIMRLQFHPTFSTTVSKGHAAGFEALNTARQILRNRQAPMCLICGVDSFVNASSLLWLDQHSRLKTESNSNGLIPGEAAAAVLVDLENPPPASHIRVAGLGFASETANILSEEPLLGLGLARATKSALADASIQMHDIDFRISDVSGESYGFKEQSLAVGRILRVRKEEFPLWHCADSIGDVGAAAGICQIVMASCAFSKQYAVGNRTACFTSSVGGERAVAIIERLEVL